MEPQSIFDDMEMSVAVRKLDAIVSAAKAFKDGLEHINGDTFDALEAALDQSLSDAGYMVGQPAAVHEVAEELAQAQAKFRPFNSAHEGYAVIAEELDELWDEVKAKTGMKSKERMREEAKQVAAMGIRFMLDVCE